MICKNCGNIMDDTVKFCTKCGQKVEETVAEVKETASEVKEEVTEAANEVKEDVAEVKEEVAEAIAEVKEEAAEAKAEATEEANDVKEKVAEVAEEVKETVTEVATDVKEAVEGAKEKVKKFPKAAWIVVAAIAVVLVVVLANFKTVSNTVNKLVLSEEKYYASVEKSELKELISNFATAYDNSFIENNDITDYSIDYGFDLEMSEEAYDMLAEELDIDDGKPLAKMALQFFVSLKKDTASVEAAASLGKNDLVSVNAVADIEKGEAYAQIPELTDKYIGVSFEDYADDLGEMLDKMDDLMKAYPTKKTLEKILNRYMTIVVENLDNVKESKDTIKVGEIEQKCTAIRVRIKEKDLYNIAVAILTEAKDDEELHNLVANFVVAMESFSDYSDEVDFDPEEIKEEFIATIEDALEELEETEIDKDSEEQLIMNVWVNNKGEVIGREFIVEDETVFIYQMPEKGKKFELEAKIIDYGDEYIFAGSGKKSSSSLSGDFAVKYKEEDEKAVKYVEIEVDKFDTKKIKEGFINGSFVIKLSKEFMNEADMGMVGSVLNSFKLKLDVKSQKSAAEVDLTILSGDDMFAKLSMDAKIGSGKSASLPSKGILVEDSEDVMEWAKTIKFDKFLKKLEKADLPDEWMDAIEDACDGFEDMLSLY